jgi:hypothetical protein
VCPIALSKYIATTGTILQGKKGSRKKKKLGFKLKWTIEKQIKLFSKFNVIFRRHV